MPEPVVVDRRLGFSEFMSVRGRTSRVNRRIAAQAGILFLASALGMALAYWIAHAIQLYEGRTELRNYAARLEQMGEQIASDTDRAVGQVADDGLPFCSDADITFMRAYIYGAPHIRDLGRVKDGKLYCTTGVGRLPMPKSIQKPDLDVGGMKVYGRAPVMLSDRAKGFIVEVAGVSVVINPDTYKDLDEPPMFFSALLYHREHGTLLPSFGHEVPLTSAEIVAGRVVERAGVMYQPLCAQRAMLCVVAAEPRSAVLAKSRALFVGFLLSGAFLGGALGLILIQAYRRQGSMENQLRRAIREGALTLVYQPIVNLETQKIVGAEALVRWVNEDGEPIRPDVFVALAEERGFVGQITRLVARRAAEELGDLLASAALRITINIAAQDIADPEFPKHLEGCLSAANVAPSSIGLELTERSTADQKMAVDALTFFKNSGHMMYIDDFGTGYSSLAYLHQLQVDAIKIDRAFTQTIGTGAVTASVVPQILAMAAQLDLLVVVEGIETREQAEYFRAAGRGILGQGWLFGKPVPAEQLRRLVG